MRTRPTRLIRRRVELKGPGFRTGWRYTTVVMSTRLPETAIPSADIDQQALDWLVRSRDGLAPEQEHALACWLDSSAAHRRAYESWQAEWEAMDAIPAPALDGLREDWRACARPAAGRFRWLRYGAGLATAAGMAIGIHLALQTPEQPQFAAHYASQAGERMPVLLPDRSRLELDTRTSIDVRQYADRRELRLEEGQALFDIQADTERPFVIQAGDIRITVTGTRFSVRYTPGQPGSDGVRIAVASGHVRIEPHRPDDSVPARELPGGKAITLTAGQRLVAAGPSFEVSSIVPADIAPWQDSRLVFDNAPLGDILSEFSRYGHTAPILSSPALSALRITGTFSSRQPDTFYRLLPQILPVRIENQAGTYVIHPAG